MKLTRMFCRTQCRQNRSDDLETAQLPICNIVDRFQAYPLAQKNEIAVR